MFASEFDGEDRKLSFLACPACLSFDECYIRLVIEKWLLHGNGQCYI